MKFLAAGLALAAFSCAFGQADWLPNPPGSAICRVSPKSAVLRNSVLEFDLTLDGTLLQASFGEPGAMLPAEPVEIDLKDGRKLSLYDFQLRSPFKEVYLDGKHPKTTVAAEAVPGECVTASFEHPDTGLRVEYTAILRDNTTYVRQILTVTSTVREIEVSQVKLSAKFADTAAVSGKVPGSVVTSGPFWFGLEDPNSKVEAFKTVGVATYSRSLPIHRLQKVTVSTVEGWSPSGQLRRAFSKYLELERARPYLPMLHYNSWYDIGLGNRFSEADALGVIQAYEEELVKKRGVKLDAFLMDDGWDDPDTVWGFDKGFPNGFTGLRSATQEFNAGLGVWLSPWGGYADAREHRLAEARKEGYEVNEGGLALSGPKYYDKFHQVCMDFVQKYGVTFFKFDGTGNVNTVIPGSQFGSDFEAMMALIKDLRQAQPNLFVNLTTGTWPSPFWTRFADSIWRGGYDHEFAGVGTWRNKWMTYRDGQTYHNIVLGGPLYPISSLMFHGTLFTPRARNLTDDPGNDFGSEVWSGFGMGSQLQELYVSPKSMTDARWDQIAAAAKWSRSHRDIFPDSHWVGGDPLKLDVYGFAAWGQKSAVLTLRNPSDKPQDFNVDIDLIFQLPAGYTGYYLATAAPGSAPHPNVVFPIGKGKVVHMAPFEVATYDCTYQGRGE